MSEIVLSTVAAEYVAFSMAMRELVPLRRLLLEICDKVDLPTLKDSVIESTIFEDNQGCLSLVNVPKMSPRNKYLALKYHWFRSHIGPAAIGPDGEPEKGFIAKYIPSERQTADGFTKSLPPAQFKVLRKLVMGW